MSAAAAMPSAGSFLLNLLQPPVPTPVPAEPSWRAEVTVAPDNERRLTPSQCPVLYDLCIGIHNRVTDLHQEELRLLAAIDLVRRERAALEPAYGSLLASVISERIVDAAKPLPAQEQGDHGLGVVSHIPVLTPA